MVLVSARSEIDDLKTRLAEADKMREGLAGAQAQVSGLQAQLADADKARLAAVQAEIDALRAQLAPVREERESVLNVKGIGPAYERRLSKVGIFTCAQLAELTPERVREIIAPKQWQKIEPEAWIAQARQLAKKTGFAEADKVREGLADAQAQLADADQTRQALVAAEAELDALKAQLAEVRRGRESVLNVNGIGPAYERRLNTAGIFTCAQLAELTPERVREIIAPKKWQKIDAEAWIAQARQFARRK
jgi:predicted flap endonuclease-1-like 5' DNA nuclease